MHQERYLFLPEPVSPPINSDNFAYYLFGHYQESRDFSDRLDLEWVGDCVNLLLNYGGSDGTTPNEGQDFSGGLERSAIFAFDPRKREYGIGPVVVGLKDKTGHNLFEMTGAGYEPLLGLHTHPIEQLLSPDDYQPLVIETSKNSRLLYAQLVVCPERQVLALATPKTPFMSGEEFDKFVKDIHEETENDPRLMRLVRRMGQLMAKKGKTLESEIRDRLKHDTTGDGMVGERSEERVLEMATTMIFSDPEFMRNVLQIGLRIKNYEARLVNWKLIETARRLNVQLYVSRDKRHFVRSSA